MFAPGANAETSWTSRIDSPEPGPLPGPPSTLIGVQAAEHRRGLGRAEVARVEGLEVARRERLQLVDGDVLADAGVAGAVQAEDAVRVRDLVVGQAAEVLRPLSSRRRTRVGEPGRMGERSGAFAAG